MTIGQACYCVLTVICEAINVRCIIDHMNDYDAVDDTSPMDNFML